MTPAPIGVAVVGADPSGRGFGARAHVPAVLASPGLRLVAVCTAHEETARRAADRWGAERWYSDYRKAVDDPEVDLVTVAVRVRAHREVVEAALAAGKAVYCEWPLGLNTGEAEALARLAEQVGRPCGVGTQGRFSPAVATARRLLVEGHVGEPLTAVAAQLLPRFAVDSDRWWLAREDEGSGALHVATAHVTDVLEVLLGPVLSLCGARATLFPSGSYADTGAAFSWTASDTVAYVARLAAGRIASVHVSNVATAAGGFSLRILGEEGQLALAAPGYVSFAQTRVLLGRNDEPELRTVLPVPSAGASLDETHPGFNVATALDRLAAAVRDGGDFHPNFDDALRLHRLVEAIARSSDGAGWVDIEPAAG